MGAEQADLQHFANGFMEAIDVKKCWLILIDHQTNDYRELLDAVWAESEEQQNKYAAALAAHDVLETTEWPYVRHEVLRGDEVEESMVAWANRRHADLACLCQETRRLVWLTYAVFHERVEWPNDDQRALEEKVTERIRCLMQFNFDYES